MRSYIWPLLIPFFSGMSTVLGGLFSVYVTKNREHILVRSLLFSSGVIFSISLFSLIKDSLHMFSISLYSGYSGLLANHFALIMVFLSVLLGIFFSKFMDSLIERRTYKNNQYDDISKNILNSGKFVMIAMIIHNFPEGIITFITSLNNIGAGLIVAVSIMLHNIPEGIAISSSIYYATKSKYKAILYSFISGVSEPIGAIFAFLFLKDSLNSTFIAVILSVAAGIMIDVSISKLFYDSKKLVKTHIACFYFTVGFLFIFFVINFLD